MSEPTRAPIWMQQPGEPRRWYVRFQIYRDLPIRTVLGTYQVERRIIGALQNRSVEPPSRAPKIWIRAAVRWNWEVRAEHWRERRHPAGDVVHRRQVWNGVKLAVLLNLGLVGALELYGVHWIASNWFVAGIAQWLWVIPVSIGLLGYRNSMAVGILIVAGLFTLVGLSTCGSIHIHH